MARFEVIRGEKPVSGDARYAVVDTANDDLPVAHFDDEAAARQHAQKLEAGPLDWEEQEAWQDEWEDDEDESS